MPDLPSPIVLAGLFGNPKSWDRLTWQPFREGIEASWVYRSADGGPATALLRYQPGAGAPAHHHAGWEHILVLAGSQQDHRGRYEAGCFIANPPGTEHSVWSDEGCVALLIWEKTPVFIEDGG
jgi:anti-sigma factor ChrR (cupin superfamily)